MSTAVFPTLDGLGWNTVKTPVWNTKVQTAVSGRELRAAYYQTPRWKFTLSYEVLRASTAHTDLQTLMGFYNLRQGSFDSFLYSDPTSNLVSNMTIGIGDGSNKTFQLVNTYGGYSEIVTAPDPANRAVLVNGVGVGGGVDPNTGIATLASAPSTGAIVTWQGGYYYRCRFAIDMSDFENFMYQLWTLKKLEFISIK